LTTNGKNIPFFGRISQVGSFPQVAGRDEISKVIARVLGKLTGRKGKGHHEQCPNVDGGVNHLEKY
jgi:hypothetical protein